VLEHLIETYGYFALFVGSFLEGESFLLISGFAAHRGYLDLRLVMFVAFAGSFMCDQLWFHLGRKRGAAFIERRPDWANRAARIRRWIGEHQLWVALSFRFLYGLRSITPMVFGATGFRPVRFAVLNGLGAAVWAVSIGYLGYAFGHVAEALLGDLQRYEVWLVVLLVTAGVVYWIVRHVFRLRRSPPSTPT
jgi:membrane protein DedA with SNARE-associated domain